MFFTYIFSSIWVLFTKRTKFLHTVCWNNMKVQIKKSKREERESSVLKRKQIGEARGRTALCALLVEYPAAAVHAADDGARLKRDLVPALCTEHMNTEHVRKVTLLCCSHRRRDGSRLRTPPAFPCELRGILGISLLLYAHYGQLLWLIWKINRIY